MHKTMQRYVNVFLIFFNFLGYVWPSNVEICLSGMELRVLKILFISGLACVIGLQRTFFFFFQKHKAKASVSFFGGIIVVLLGWPMTGMIFELYGFVLLFRGFLPSAVNFLRMIPVIGTLLNLPILRGIVDRIAGDTSRTMV